MSNLLVVDWDYFFPNLAESGDNETDLATRLLYDWGHAENDFMINKIWPIRASGFLRQGLDLPQCRGYGGWWDRFRFAPDAELTVADSNAYAATLPGAFGFDAVWLYDAHHDAGYREESLDEFLDSNRVTCENWMMLYAARGAELHVRYPAWKRGLTVERDPVIEVDRAMDDGTAPDVEFGTVFVCRSGAWVPPWCDDQFAEFVGAFPGGQYRSLDEEPLRRDFDLAAAERDRAQVDLLMQSVMEKGS